MAESSGFRNPPLVSVTYKCSRRCPYCFTANFAKKFPGEMALSDFRKLADWLSAQGLNRLGLLGGESTQHPKFPEMLEIAAEKGVRMKLGTSGLFGERVAEALSSKVVHAAIVNFNEPETYSKEELALLYKNLETLKEKGINTIIRFNAYPGIKGLAHIGKVCRKFGIREVYFAFTVPDLEFSMPYTSFAEMQKLFPLVRETVERLERAGIKCLAPLPLPKCALSPEDYGFLEDRGTKAKCGYKKGEFMPLLLIQPDLSVNACARLPFRLENILDYERIEDVWAEFRGEWEKLSKEPLFEECKECGHSASGECTGSCLVYKLAKKAAPVF